MKNTVQLTRTEFENLLKARFDLIMVKDVLLNSAHISWNGRYLIWSDETASVVLRHIMGDKYEKKLEELKSKVEELNKEDSE